MNKSASFMQVLTGLAFVYVLAFLLVKTISVFLGAEMTGHFAIAGVLVLLPLIHRRGDALRAFNILGKAKSPWAGLACFAYALLPILLLMLFYPQEWLRARIELGRWFFSGPGMLAIFLAPVAEEFFFRGWLLNAQMKSARAASATHEKTGWMDGLKVCYINALLFWLMHVPLPSNFVSLWSDALSTGQIPLSPGPFLLGLATSAMTLTSGSPRSALVFHMLANTMGPVWWPLLSDHHVRNFFYF
ncbi:MAG: CPBP family intramembrane glutamic endopeptidase [Silvanigrellaceae bacterium]